MAGDNRDAPLEDAEKAEFALDTLDEGTRNPSLASAQEGIKTSSPASREQDVGKKKNGDDGVEMRQVASHGSQLPLSKARTIALVAVLTGAAFLNTLSIQVCVIILPTIGADLDIPAARQQWIVSSYSLTFGCFLLLWGRLADVYGKRIIFIYGSAWVSVITLICPFLPNEIGFDIFRGLQGLGAAANVPTAIGILGVTFQPGKAKNYAFATYSAGAPLGSVFGNILGGVVGQYATWKWAFWILAILAALVTLAGWYLIPLPTAPPAESKVKNAVDWVGGVLVTVGLVILLFALTEGNVVGWSTPWIPVLIVVSILLVAAFVLWQLYLENKTTRRPLMKVSIFKNLRVSAAMLVMTFFFAGFNSFLIFATYYFQDYQGHDAIMTTVRFLPTGVVGVMTIFVTSQMLARIKVNYIMMFGTLCTAVSSLLFAVPISPRTTYWAYGFPAMCLSVFGADTVFPSLLLFTAHSLPREDQAIGGAIINAVGQIGRAIGLAIATAIQVAVQESKQGSQNAAIGGKELWNPDFLSGLRAAEWFNFAISLVAFGIATVAFRGAEKVGAAKK
ncbi:drug resistance [Lecanosticta acicola]|uniref:Drug resistance n=1 Tax=Lecanosticta acicola TaxID=111012 RepID=A0AAI8W0J0_9PEZI|nr:drug resistance [Lecanosticta acicola]